MDKGDRMSWRTIDQDILSELSLLKDGNDPPRFYVQHRHRRELIAIGDEALARSRFAAWKARAFESWSRMKGRPAVNPVAAISMAARPAIGPVTEVTF